MYKERTQEKIYTQCITDGSIINIEHLDQKKIKSMVKLALNDWNTIKGLIKKTPKDSGGWNIFYKTHYDTLPALADAFIRFDKIKVRTHECLFTFLCEKHPELELDWGFFDKVRTKRNGSMYYGEAISYDDWKEIEIQINLYINTLKTAVEEKLE
jgi:hypothetical protein